MSPRASDDKLHNINWLTFSDIKVPDARMTHRFKYDSLPGTYDPRNFPPTANWKWIASIGRDTESPVKDKVHLDWIRKEGNVHAPPHREVMLALSGETVFGFAGDVYKRSPGTVFLFDHYESRDWRRSPRRTIPNGALWLHLNSRHFLTYNTVALNKRGSQIREIPTGCILSGDTPRLIMEGPGIIATTKGGIS